MIRGVQSLQCKRTLNLNQEDYIMNYKQNEKILQLTDKTLIIGIDIAKHTHVARAQDFRGVQFGKPLYLENSLEGFQTFTYWMNELTAQHENPMLLSVWSLLVITGCHWLIG